MPPRMDELVRVHRILCSPFVNEELFRRALGSGRADIGTVARYLAMPTHKRPVLSFYFDRDYYYGTNADIQRTGADGLLHFITTGIIEQRSPHPLIDLKYIGSQQDNILGQPPTVEALLDLLEYDLASPSPYFDLDYYRRILGPGHTQTGLLRHFLTQGLAGGLRPNPYLDPAWYAQEHVDAPDDLYQALRHFLILGDIEGRAAGPLFDGRLYLARYPDIRDAEQAPLRHFLLHGRLEGRQSASDRKGPRLASRGTGVASAPSQPVGLPIPVDPGVIEDAHAHMLARLAAVRQERKDAVTPTEPRMAKTVNPVRDLAGIAFPQTDAPKLSVLIPVFNELDVTVECLMALRDVAGEADFEVIVADDCSTEANVGQLADVPNLIYRRGAANAGFIRTCNAAFAACRGRYVLLLNNDTQVQPGAIARMVNELDAHADVAAVGPKLIYPDGRLQEAGCFLRASGAAEMVGLFGDPADGGFCFDRDVPYCSGAALMVRREAVGPSLFDEAYLPAYCEDADLCLRLQDDGHRVRYVHEAVVVHHLSLSTNRQSQERKLRMVTRNQQRLAERWGALLAQQNRTRVLAFHLPQFHPTPENDLWWGAGFTEWTNVSKARPSYEGHYQPHLPADLGFYDLRTAEALTRQALLAARYGIEGFVVYYYNFGARRVLHRPIEVVRASPEIPFRWCLCWANENWTKHWDGGEREILLEQRYDTETLRSIIADAVEQAADPRYIRVDDKPMFLVYRPLSLPDARGFAAQCRAAFERAGFQGVHLVYVESMEAVDRGVGPAELGFDACAEFPPHGRAVPADDQATVIKEDWTGYRYDYPETALTFIHREGVPYKRYPAVFPSWDNTPRQPLRGTSFDDASPEAFRTYVEEKLDEVSRFLMGDERLLFINAWNEWAEGAHLEPDTGYGHRWLEALRDGLTMRSWS